MLTWTGAACQLRRHRWLSAAVYVALPLLRASLAAAAALRCRAGPALTSLQAQAPAACQLG